MSCFPSDGTLGIEGMTYEWIDAPDGATSRIYLESVTFGGDMESTLERMQDNITSDISIAPLKGVNIAIGPKRSIEKRGEENYIWETRPDLKGNVRDFWITAPGKEQLLVKARKSGYMEVVGEVEHTGTSDIAIIVILVKENDQS
jgi:hypothetical protein